MQSSTAGIAGSRVPYLSETAVAAANARALSRETLGRLGVESAMVFFPDVERQLEGFVFRYGQRWKSRSVEGKHFVAEKGFKLGFWNIENVLRSSLKVVYITEGEFDACALVESGIPFDQVLSVPNGAVERTDRKETRGLGYVEEALRAGLNRTKKFVWCGDSDGPGLALRDDMARVLGVARLWFVNWPEGCKDANDLLKSDGAVAVRELVTDGALQWPVNGLYRLDELPEPAPLTLWRPGFAEWENKVFLAPRTLSVVTGNPGHGKTIFWGQVWFQVTQQYDVPICMASFETRPKPHHRRQLRTLYCGRLERDLYDDEVRKADAWINERYHFIVHPEQRPTPEWLLDMAEVAVVRHGARVLQIDPWNRVEAARTREETETEYIGRCLRTFHVFANDMNCHVQVVAHPAKVDHQRRGKPPELEDISGSKNWDNMVDQGFVVFRPEIFDGVNRKTEASLYHRKTRFDDLGYSCKLSLRLDLASGRYVSTDYEQ